MFEDKATNFDLIEEKLYKRGTNHNLSLCVLENKYLQVLKNACASVLRGHVSFETIAKNIFCFGLWRPAMHHNLKDNVEKCEDYHDAKPPTIGDDMLLFPIVATIYFYKWDINVLGLIKPPSWHMHEKYIIVAIDYFTKWVKYKATIKNIQQICKILIQENFYTMRVANRDCYQPANVFH